jgi:hypothetical protein
VLLGVVPAAVSRDTTDLLVIAREMQHAGAGIARGQCGSCVIGSVGVVSKVSLGAFLLNWE